MRVIAAMFFVGGILVASLLLGAGTGDVPTGWGRVGAWLIACAHIGVGAWYLFVVPRITARLDPSDRVLTLTRGRIFHRERRRIHVTEILDVLTRVDRDSDGDPVWTLELRLRTGEHVPLHSVGTGSEAEIADAKERLRVWSGGQIVFRQAGHPLEAG